MASKKRQMLFVPEVNPASFVFFFERGNSGASWSIRDYSVPNRVRETRPGDRPWLADEIFPMARHAFDAPTVPTTDLAFWHRYTAELNEKYKIAPGSSQGRTGAVSSASVDRPSQTTSPMLCAEQFSLLAKARDTRVLSSPNSEDWVTWNVLSLLQLEHPHDWWEKMLAAATDRNPDLELPSPSSPYSPSGRASPRPKTTRRKAGGACFSRAIRCGRRALLHPNRSRAHLRSTFR